MIERLDRARWLRDELRDVDRRLAALGGPPEDVSPGDMDALFAFTDNTRLSADRDRIAAELAELEVGVLRLRVTGQPVHGSSIEADALGDLIHDLDKLARANGGSLMIGVPSPGSHVVEVQPPVQRGIFDDPVVATAGMLIDAFGLAYDQAIESGIAAFAVERHPDSLDALTRLVEHVAGHAANLELEAEAGGARQRRPLDRAHANSLLLALKDVTEATTAQRLRGRFGGALESRGRFEIKVGDETVRGSVPVAVRPQLVGLRIGDDVIAVVDEIVSRRATGSEGRRLRLRSIAPADSPDPGSG
jgi:hypothetical protein